MNVDQSSQPVLDPEKMGSWPLSSLVTKELVLDLLERAVVLALFIYFVHRILPRIASLVAIQIAHPDLLLPAAAMNVQAVLLVTAEALGVALILARRRSVTVSSNPIDWTLSFAAVSATLLLTTPAPAGTLIPPQIATSLMIAGLALQISAKVSLWRSFGVVPANHGIKIGGPYRMVRHPMYAGYTLTHIGFLLGFPLLQNALLYGTVIVIEVARLMREEAVLRQDPIYRNYIARIRYRLCPGVF